MELRETVGFKKRFCRHRDRTGDWLSGGGRGVRDFEFLVWAAGGSWVILVHELGGLRRVALSEEGKMYVVLEMVSFKCLGYPGGSVSQAVGLHSSGDQGRGGRERERGRQREREVERKGLLG